MALGKFEGIYVFPQCTVEELGIFLSVCHIGGGHLKFSACFMKHMSFISKEQCEIVKQMAFYEK